MQDAGRIFKSMKCEKSNYQHKTYSFSEQFQISKAKLRNPAANMVGYINSGSDFEHLFRLNMIICLRNNSNSSYNPFSKYCYVLSLEEKPVCNDD